jgi:membrane protein DedA with SNARE-associated domain
MLQGLYDAVVDLIRSHSAWTTPILFALAFAESIAFVSLFVPAWTIIVAAGALSGANAISFVPALIAASAGAALGDWVSYSLASVFRDRLSRMWPFTKNPQSLRKAQEFVQKWGAAGVFIGRFFGPLRATVPLAAGMLGLSYWPFQVANFSSALVWSAVLLSAGRFGQGSLPSLLGS